MMFDAAISPVRAVICWGAPPSGFPTGPVLCNLNCKCHLRPALPLHWTRQWKPDASNCLICEIQLVAAWACPKIVCANFVIPILISTMYPSFAVQNICPQYIMEIGKIGNAKSQEIDFAVIIFPPKTVQPAPCIVLPEAFSVVNL